MLFYLFVAFLFLFFFYFLLIVIVSHSSVSLFLRIIKQFNMFYLFFSNYAVPSPTMTTVISPSAASSSSLTTASMQPIRPGMFLKAYHIPTCYILQHETSLRFPEISTDVKIKKQTNKQTNKTKQTKNNNGNINYLL